MTRQAPIAIVGWGALCPDGDQPGLAACHDASWRALRDGRSRLSDIPRERWRLEPSQYTDARDRVGHLRAGVIHGFNAADTTGLAIEAHDLQGYDLGSHFAVDCTRRALEGLASWRELDPARIAVTLGHIALPTAHSTDWTQHTRGPGLQRALGIAPERTRAWPPAHRDGRRPMSTPIDRVARALGATGPALAFDAACASSLFALSSAIDLLENQSCDLVLAGGLSRADSMFTQVGFERLGALSKSGHCRPFDQRADGLIVGEGCAIFALMRLDDALARELAIKAVLMGAGLSNSMDGRLLAPSREGQGRAIREAYARAGWRAGDIDLIECHATGTRVGDGTELRSLCDYALAPGPTGTARRPVLTAAKANVGHWLTGAGGAGLHHLLTALQHQTLPPIVGHTQPLAELDDAAAPLRVLQRAEAWERPEHRPRRAALSGFGFGGTNAHLLLSEYDEALMADSPGTRVAVAVPREREPLVVLASALQRPTGSSLHVDYGSSRVPPKEIERSLPQQIGMLQTAGQALAQALGLPEQRPELARGRRWQLGPRAGAFIGIELDPRANDFCLRWSVEAQAKPWARALGLPTQGRAFSDWQRRLCDAVSPPLDAERTVGALGGIVSSRIAREFGLGGACPTISAGPSTGLEALAYAQREISAGRLDLALVGAVDFARDDPEATGGDPANCCVAMVLCSPEFASRHRLETRASLALDHGPRQVVPERDPCISTPITELLARVHAVLETGERPGVGTLRHEGSTLRVELTSTAGVTAPEEADANAHVDAPGIKVPIERPWPPRELPVESSPAPTTSPAPPSSATQPRPSAVAVAGEPRAASAQAVGPGGDDSPSIRAARAMHEAITIAGVAMAAQERAHAAYLTADREVAASIRALALNASGAGAETRVRRQAADPASPTTPRQQAALPNAGRSDAAAPERDRPLIDREGCMKLAIGSVAEVLGPRFAEVDSFPTRVRLPDEPLMLVDRIMEIDAEPLSMNQGSLVTEHDVRPGAWYLDNGRIPTCVAVEAGQADLFLSGYLGIDFETRGLAKYRLLDAVVTFHDRLPRVGQTIRYAIRIHRFFHQSGSWFFQFEFDATVEGRRLMTMRDGCAGFFSDAQLAAGRGVRAAKISPRQQARASLPWPEAYPPVQAELQLSEYRVDALRQGDLVEAFGREFAGLELPRPLTIPGGHMRLVHRITQLDPKGGHYGRGRVVGEADIDPEAWFLVSHFCDDMVMPGTLMYECCLHTLRVLLLRMGWVASRDEVHCEPIDAIRSRLECRGQVLQSTERVTYDIEIEAIIEHEGDLAIIAHALMYADDKAIVRISDMTLRLCGLSAQTLEARWQNRRRGPLHTPYDGPLVHDRERVLAYSAGRPSQAFGPPYEIFDRQRRLARLPQPPFQFIDRVCEVEGEPFDFRTGSACRAQFDLRQLHWFFGTQPGCAMPFAVLLEIALQPCGWLAAYVGSALQSDTDLSFRNLGGTAKLMAPIVAADERLEMHARLVDISQSAGMILQRFEMRVDSVDRDTTIYAGSTQFGFFSGRALSNQVGLREPELPEFLGHDQPGGYRLPATPPYADERMRMVDRIETVDLNAGTAQLGRAQASIEVDGQAWFFWAHFFQDPVWPGSLGLQAFVQVVQELAIQRWQLPDSATFSTLAVDPGHDHQWNYRGQVLPTARRVEVVAEITGEKRDAGQITARGWLGVDGRWIYAMTDFTVQLHDNEPGRGA